MKEKSLHSVEVKTTPEKLNEKLSELSNRGCEVKSYKEHPQLENTYIITYEQDNRLFS